MKRKHCLAAQMKNPIIIGIIHSIHNLAFINAKNRQFAEAIKMRRGSLKGYIGEITRVVKIQGTKKEFFIKGKEESTYEEVLRNSWQLKDHDVNGNWRVLSASGDDLTKSKLSSYEGTVLLEFIE